MPMITVKHIYKGLHSFWAPKEAVDRILEEYAEMEWFVHRPRGVKRRDDRND